MTQRHETQIGTKPGHLIHMALAEGDIQQLTSTPENNTQRLGEQMHNSNEVTHRYPQKYVSQNLKIPILWETPETIPRTWSSYVSLLSNFTTRKLSHTSSNNFVSFHYLDVGINWKNASLIRNCWAWDLHSNESATVGKHVIKYKDMRKLTV